MFSPTRKAPQIPLGLLASFERFVCDTPQRLYIRLFAWYRLVRFWSSMRFDDHRGLVPTAMTLRSGSLRGTLVRTKTTGAGKRQEQLFINVGVEAFVCEPTWLATG